MSKLGFKKRNIMVFRYYYQQSLSCLC